MIVTSMLALMLGAAPSPAKIVCPHRDGFIDGPVVPSVEAAQGIFAVVSSALAPNRPKDKFMLGIRDAGDAWVASETLVPRGTTRDGAIIAVRGGGGLTMRIDKCTGAISEMYYQR